MSDLTAQLRIQLGLHDTDNAVLAKLWPSVAPKVGAIIDALYARSSLTPGLPSVLGPDPARFRADLERFVHDLLSPELPEDAARLRASSWRELLDAGLPVPFAVTTIAFIRTSLAEIAFAEHAPEEAHRMSLALDRATSLDLSLAIELRCGGRPARDLAALQELIVSQLPVGVLLLDKAGIVVAGTRAGLRLTGGAGSVIGRPYSDVLPRPLISQARLDNAIERAADTRDVVWLPPVDVLLDEVQRSFRIGVVPLDDAAAATLIHVEDVTEAVAAEARLRRSESLAQLGAMSAAVAHELRNPLAGISGAIQVIARSFPEQDRRRVVMEKIEEQIRRLNDLVTDLLTFARPDPARVSDLDLTGVVQGVVDDVQRHYPAITVRVDGQGRAHVDGRLLGLALRHLLVNAAQAMDGTGTVLIRIGPGEILVNDAGPGIPVENRDAIFTPFFTTRTRGTGLGLSIGQNALSAMGGEVSLASGPLPGAAFRIKLRTEQF